MNYYCGIHKGHNSSAVMLGEDGKISKAIEEERLTRVKMQGGFPALSLDFVKEKNIKGIATGQLSRKRYLLRFAKFYLQSLSKNLTGPNLSNMQSMFMDYVSANPSKAAKSAQMEKFKEIEGQEKKLAEFSAQNNVQLQYFDHHFCHAASAYYPSGFKNALIMTVDGQGDCYSATIYEGKDGKLERLKYFFQNENTLGMDYEIVTAMLGFNPLKHAGKITGLAAFGKSNSRCIARLEKFLKSFRQRKTKKGFFSNHYYYLNTVEGIADLRKFRETFFGGFSREDIAFAIQTITEQEIISMLESVEQDFSSKNIALAGGVFANVKVNQRVKELGFRNVFIQPAMNDAGVAIGAAYLALLKDRDLKPSALENSYFGPSWINEEIKKILDESRLKYQKDEEIESTVAGLVDKGKVVARFDGRMEFGPRALGHRSILYHTRDRKINDWLNKRLKRTEFMPFAPSSLAEFADKCYVNVKGAEHPAHFMTMCFDCTPWMQDACPAVVHVDNTARPQLVDKKTDASYYKIIKEYYKLTGIPVIVNTSFNMHEEPIVCTPQDAIRSFKQGHLDYLAIGSFLLKG